MILEKAKIGNSLLRVYIIVPYGLVLYEIIQNILNETSEIRQTDINTFDHDTRLPINYAPIFKSSSRPKRA